MHLEPTILHVLPRDGIGGVEVAARSMLNSGDLSCRFRLLLLSGEAIAESDGAVLTTSATSALDPRAIWRGAAMAVAEQPDVVILSLWRTVPLGILLRLLQCRCRIAFMLHSDRPTHFLDRLFSWFGMRIAHEVWADAEATLSLRGVPPRTKTRVISFVLQGVSALPPEVGRPGPRFVTWSRLAYEKGTDRAIQFIALLRKHGIDATFDVWGPDAGHLLDLRRLVANLKVGPYVRFRGPAAREALPSIASENSFFLQLSRQEGMAIGTVEAMQYGLVPITTAVGQMGHYIIPDRTGVIVAPDHPEPAVSAVERLIREPARFAELRRNCMQRWQQARTYAQDVCTAATELAGIRRVL
jgi:glycosyltransferase involved in cell wall biosynthesis